MTILTATILVFLLAQAPQPIEIPFELAPTQPVILVRAVVNGRPALLILDTGASQTILRSELLRERLRLEASRFAHGGPGLTAHGRWSQATLQLGDRVWRNRQVVAMNFDEVTRTYGAAIDGLLGQDLLREFDRVTIDYRKGRVVLASGETAPACPERPETAEPAAAGH